VRHLRVLVALGGVLVAGASVRAHEIGTTRVTILLPATARYEIQIVTDAASLAEKVGAAAGSTPIDTTDPAALRQRLEELGAVFRGRFVIAFDGRAVRPDLAWKVEPSTAVGGAPVATIRLSGPVPDAARQLTWSYAWTFASYALVARRDPAGQATTEWLEGGETSAPLALLGPSPMVSPLRLGSRYVALGFTHILPHGLDHVLFVLGLFLLSRRLRPLLLQVSAFTVAHSITLGLGLYGLLTLPASIVEPLIAISIAYIALENIFLSHLNHWRVVLVFAFGLLHGLGFAGALKEVGLPRSEFATALLSFNVGVELGQLTVIGLAFLLVGLPYANRVWYRSRIVLPASALIACFGVYWTVERLFKL